MRFSVGWVGLSDDEFLLPPIKDLGSDLVRYCSSSRRLPTIGRVKAMGAMIVLINATPVSAEPSATSVVPV